MRTSSATSAVAIIGAGPAGLVCARWLISRGFSPILFEASGDLGGQWNAASPLSATWPGMVTNTSRVMTAFSDRAHPEGTPTYPTREAMHAYLIRYAEQFDLIRRIRLHTRVEHLSRDGDFWRLRWRRAETTGEEVFAKVVVATGRQIAPEMPEVPGLESFSGGLGVHHTRDYQGASGYRNATVVVGGCSISALEIATDLAHAGARVVTAFRRQRYILPKVQAGVPTDHVMFTRAAALAGERLPEEATARALRDRIVAVNGRPDQWGALVPDEDVRLAGITQAQGFLPAVAEGRIRTAPWIDAVDGRRVRFVDGSGVEADAVLFGTGFELSLPFIDTEIAATLDMDAKGMDLYAETLHPDLPGLAFLGQYSVIGPYFPVLELQARWLAESWSGNALDDDAMRAAMAYGASTPLRGASVPMHVLAIMFARLAQVEPTLADHPELERALLFGPLSAVSFRLLGPDADPCARDRIRADAAAFGHLLDAGFTPDESQMREALEAAASSRSAHGG